MPPEFDGPELRPEQADAHGRWLMKVRGAVHPRTLIDVNGMG